MVGEIEIGSQAGEMGHQLADGDVLFAVAGKVWQVGGNGVVELDLAGVDELHHGGGGGDALGERSEIEDGIEGHWLAVGDGVGLCAGFERAVAEGLAVDDLAIVKDEDDGSGDGALGDGLLDDAVNIGKASVGHGLLFCRLRDRLRGTDGKREKQRQNEKQRTEMDTEIHAVCALSGIGMSRLEQYPTRKVASEPKTTYQGKATGVASQR
uniref:Uncharacterized protein n=1 Tax=mine drainage metagenome TaxID=410659 RepID=E6QKK2_9ZZZZ